MTRPAQRSLARAAARAFTLVTPLGLRPIPRDWTREQDVAFGRSLIGIGEALPWNLGDYILAMEKKHGESYAQIAHDAGFNPHSGQNLARVAERIARSRRRESLPWAIHAEVANLEPKEQDGWLDQAEKGQWTREELRAKLGKGKKALEAPHPPHLCRACGAMWDGNEPTKGEP